MIAAGDRIHRAYLALLSRRSGGTVSVEDDLFLWAGTDPRPWIVNGAMTTAEPARSLVERARSFFGRLGHGFSVTVREHADRTLRPLLEEEGFTEAIQLPVMATTARVSLSVPSGAEIRFAATAGDVAAYASVAKEAFGPELAGAVDSAFGRPDAVLASDTHAAIATGDDGPESVALSFVDGDSAGVYWVGTRAASMRRGLGAATTAAATNAAFDHGAKAVFLQASPMGAPLYERLGFREITRYTEMQAPWR